MVNIQKHFQRLSEEYRELINITDTEAWLRKIKDELHMLTAQVQYKLDNLPKYWYIEFTGIDRPADCPGWFHTAQDAELWLHRHFTKRYDVLVQDGIVYINNREIGGITYMNKDDTPEVWEAYALDEDGLPILRADTGKGE